MSFGKKLKILRISNGLDQDKISKRLNISQPVYSRYENDEKEVNESNPIVKKVAEEFDVTPYWLLSAENNMLHEMREESFHQQHKYYTVPAAFLDAMLKQQQMIEDLLKMLSVKKVKAGNP